MEIELENNATSSADNVSTVNVTDSLLASQQQTPSPPPPPLLTKGEVPVKMAAATVPSVTSKLKDLMGKWCSAQ